MSNSWSGPDKQDQPPRPPTDALSLFAQRFNNAIQGIKIVTPTPRYSTLAKVAEPPKSKWSFYWLIWVFGMVITGFVIPEANALLNKQRGDTLSENVREWLKTDTPGGGASWLAVSMGLLTLVVWLTGHIAQWPNWPLTDGN